MKVKAYLIFCVICILRDVVEIECLLGGQFATEGQFPYLVSIQMIAKEIVGDRGTHYAGGVIVSSRFVLSTATYLTYSQLYPNATFVLFGTIDERDKSNKIGTETITFHPSYDLLSMKNDIALLRTSEAFVFTEFVKFLMLPTLDLPVEGGTKANVSGWGLRDRYLTFTTTVTISVANCRRILYGLDDIEIHDTNVCTTNPVNVGLCDGDYGSPLVDEKQFVIGLASRRSTGCGEEFPDVYTRVQPYVEWIDGVIRDLPTTTPAPISNSNTNNMIPALIILQIFVIFVNLN